MLDTHGNAYIFRRDDDAEAASGQRFGFAQTVDGKLQRRLFEALKLQGCQLSRQNTNLPDDGKAVRDLQHHSWKLSVFWIDVAIKQTVLEQYGKALVHCDQILGAWICDQSKRPVSLDVCADVQLVV